MAIYTTAPGGRRIKSLGSMFQYNLPTEYDENAVICVGKSSLDGLSGEHKIVCYAFAQQLEVYGPPFAKI